MREKQQQRKNIWRVIVIAVYGDLITIYKKEKKIKGYNIFSSLRLAYVYIFLFHPNKIKFLYVNIAK